MNFANIVGGALRFSVMISVMALVTACNTTPAVRSSGAPGAPGSPGPSGSPGSSGPSVQVGVSGMPEVPGLPGQPTAGSGGTPDTPVPGRISIPATQTGESKLPGGSGSTAGTGREKTDDEILAEALRELNKRREPGQQGEGAAGHMPQAGAGDPARTDAEKKQTLGGELEEGFAEFDQLMLGEQQAINEQADQEGYGGFPEGDDFPGEGGSVQNPGEEPLQTAMVDSDPVSIKGEGNIPTRSHSQVPPDLVDAKGDDIIARQLREAAMKEQDPELRDKLWDEYRKYKRDLR